MKFGLPQVGTIALTLAFAGLVHAADRKQELQERFAQRDASLQSLKRAGKVGETTQGLVEAVKPEYLHDKELAGIVQAENADRRELYAIIAKETGATHEVVAEQNARRNFERARPGDWLRTAAGEWRQKQ
jgi:uncharacterized protein YdbL (DUF1318 family)